MDGHSRLKSTVEKTTVFPHPSFLAPRKCEVQHYNMMLMEFSLVLTILISGNVYAYFLTATFTGLLLRARIISEVKFVFLSPFSLGQL